MNPSTYTSHLPALLDAIAVKSPSRIAVEDHDGVLTYAQLVDYSKRIARRIGSQKERPICINLKRDRLWLCAVFGAIRCGAVICMSSDLESDAEKQRNNEIVTDLKPAIIVGTTDDMSDVNVLLLTTIEDVLNLDAEGDLAWEQERAGQTLYYNYTGGSTSASKCVQVSQEMACYEVEVGYPSVCTLPSSAKVLQHTSCYWGASCLGQLSYWLAFQCTLVVVEDGQRDVGALTRVVNKFGVTVIGVVPSVLDALRPQDCPSVDTIFTWGEALSSSTVETWKTVKIYDLLIATEYWLCLYREPPAHVFQVLPDVIVSIRSDQHEEVAEGEVGELFLAGPMVTKLGYITDTSPFHTFDDSPHTFYRTKDLVRMADSGRLKFCGRADDYAKVGGHWIDINDIETELDTIAADCGIVWDPVGKIRHVCLVLQDEENAASTVWRATKICPKESIIHVFAELPRNSITNKVDRLKLLQMVAPPQHSLPAIRLDEILKLVPNPRVAAILATMCRQDNSAKAIRNWSRWWQGLHVFKPATSDLFYVLHKIAHDSGTNTRVFEELCDRSPFHFLGLIHLIRRRMPLLELFLRIHRPRKRSWHTVFFLGIGMYAEKMARSWGWWWWQMEAESTVKTLKTFLARPVHRCDECKKIGRHGHGGVGYWFCKRCWDRWNENWNNKRTLHVDKEAETGAKEPKLDGSSPPHSSGSPSGNARKKTSVGTDSTRPAEHSPLAALFPPSAPHTPQETNAVDNDSDSPTPMQTDECATGAEVMAVDGPPVASSGALFLFPNGPGRDLSRDTSTTSLMNPSTSQPSASSGAGAEGADTPSLGALVLEGVDVKGISLGETTSTTSDSGKDDAEEKGNGTKKNDDDEVTPPAPPAPPAPPPTFTNVDFDTDVLMEEKDKRKANTESADPLIRILENLTGLDVDEDFELAALDSLRLITLVFRLRPHPWNFTGSFADLRNVFNVTELRELIATSKPKSHSIEMVKEAKIYICPRFFRAPVSWTLELKSPLDTVKLRAAVYDLIRLHSGLRISLSESDECIQFTNEAAACLRMMQSVLPQGNAFGQLLVTELLDFWPPVKVQEPKEEYEDAFGCIECKHEKEMHSWIRHLSRAGGFFGPFCVTYLTIPSKNKYYLLVAVNHAMGDAGVILPLCNELLQLVDGASLKSIPDSLKLQEERLLSTLLDQDRGDGVNLSWLNPLAWRRTGNEHYIILQHRAAAMMRSVASNLRIPVDQVLIALVACTVARLRLISEPELNFLPVKVLIPNRDGVGEQDIVGNLSSDRDFELSLTNQTLVGAMHEISSLIKGRKWRVPSALDPMLHSRICINLRAALVELHGGAKNIIPSASDYLNLAPRTRGVESHLEVFADECDDGRWSLQCRVAKQLPNHLMLGRVFKQTLKEFFETPRIRLRGLSLE